MSMMEEKQQDNHLMDAIDIKQKQKHLLGHCQKKFKRELPGEKLGSRFGDYGSFLPPPSVLLHPIIPPIMENNSTKKLPNKPPLKHKQLVAASTGGTILSANDASAAKNILSGLDSDREMAVTAVSNSRVMEDSQLEEGEIPFNQDHQSNFDPDVAFNNSREMEDSQLEEGEIPFDQDHQSNFDPDVAFNNSREMEDSQLEEGEIPFDQDHQSNFDPDVAYSYIDAKIENLLGHFQKEFKGEHSAETLGPKFGRYGSFLTNHQGSPSEFRQPKTAAIVQKLPNKGVVEIMTSHNIPGDPLLTPLSSTQPQLTEKVEKVFPKEPENLVVKTEFQNNTSTNRNYFELVKKFQGLKANKAIFSGNKRESTEIKETRSKFGKNAPNNCKRPTKTSSKDFYHGWLERGIIGESGNLTLKTSDPYMKGTKEASKDKFHQFYNWVACDACEKWRLLPPWVEPSSLPKKWFCQMLSWLPDMNRCDVSEDSTTQAVNGMYSIQPDQCQVDGNKEQLQHSGSINHSSFVSKNNKSSSVRINSSTDVVQKHLEKVEVGKGILQQAITGNGYVMGIDKFKQEEKWKLKHNASNRAEGNAGQGKRKNEVEEGVHKSLKKIKLRVATDGSNSQLSTVPRESSKAENWHEPLIHSVKPFVKGKSSTDVLKHLPEKNQPGTCILNQEIKANGIAIEMHKCKQGEKWKIKQNASNRGEGTSGQGERKNEGEVAVHKPLKKTKARLAIYGSNGELSTVLKESSKVDNLHRAVIHSTKPLSTIVVAGRDTAEAVAASPVRRELGQAAGKTALKEARDLKRTADRLKAIEANGHDITRLYFEAALKFLQAASLLEPSHLENAEHGEVPQSTNLYTDSARLFEYCASTYDRNKEMAAAALAYKCMGVACTWLVLSKRSCLTREWHELRAAFQKAPLGESPTISSTYIDNSNNHPLMDENFVNPSKIDGSPHVAGNHGISAPHHSHFLHVLQYIQDAIASMGAFKKSEIAFSAAMVNSPDGNKGTDKMSEVKRVIDFSFHDIDRLVQLVRIALESLYH